MYVYLGQGVVVDTADIVGVFDLDNTTWSHRTRRFLDMAAAQGQVVEGGEDLPRSFVLCHTPQGGTRVYLSQLNTATLCRRIAHNPWVGG